VSPKRQIVNHEFGSSYAYQQFGFVQVSSAALAAHQQLYLDITIPTGGYLYTYVANESNVSASTSVYFDDFTIIHTRNASTLQVAQTTDYYPFGLAMAAQSYQKQSSLDNDYLYNGKELQDEHNLGWLDYGARMYMSEIGRWGVVDALAEIYHTDTPYGYVLNNPLSFIDPDGRQVEGVTKDDARKAHEGFNKVFAGEKFDTFRALITRSGKKGDGKTFNKIDADALSGALEGLEGDDLALAELFAGAINSDDVHKVEFAELGDDLSSGAVEGMNTTMTRLFTDNNLTVPTMPTSRKADEVKAAGGSGQNFPTSDGSHSVILEGTGITNSGGRREIDTFHEVFGHGIPTAKKTTDAINNRHAIQRENLVRRVLGIKQQRDGSNHSGGKLSNPSALPKIN